MTVRTHATDTPTTAHLHRSGYRSTRGADTYVTTHTAPTGMAYVATDGDLDPTDLAPTYDVWCVPMGDQPTMAETDPALLFDDPAPWEPLTESVIVARFATAHAANAWIATHATYGTDRFHHGASYTVPTDTYGNTYGYDTDAITYTVWAHPSDTYRDATTNADGTSRDDTDHTPAIPNTYTGTPVAYLTNGGDGTPSVAPMAAVGASPVGAPTPHGVTPHTGAHTEPGYTGHVCTIAAGVTITGTYRDADTDGTVIDVAYTGTVGTPTGMASLGNAGYRVHTADGGMITVSRLAVVTIVAPGTYAPTDTDDDTQWAWIPMGVREFDRNGVRIVGAWLDTHTGDMAVHTADGPVYVDTPDTYRAPGAMVPYATYAGTSRHGTDYTVTTDGTITTRTYADGTTTYADATHMWTTTTAHGDTVYVAYVVADGTYWVDDARVSSASWPMVATCGHDHAGYGACIAPYGHPHTDHRDANGHTFTGPAMTRYAGTYGPTTPPTYTRVVTRVPMHRDTYRTVLRADVADMVNDYAYIMAAMGHPFRTDGAAYAALVRTMDHGTYDPSVAHYTAWSDTLDAHYGIND